MKSKSAWQVRLAQILLGVVIVIALVVVRGSNAGNPPVHLATDWSHRHVIFSAPKSLAQQIQLLSNPRYAQQLVRRGIGTTHIIDRFRWRAPEGTDTLQGDWSEDMGSGATVGAGQFPAKFSYNATTANCITPVPPTGYQPDFVAYNTSVTSTAASQSATVSAEPSYNSTFTISNGTNTLTMHASYQNANTGTGTGDFTRASNTTTQAADIATALNLAGNGSYVGITATSSGAVVTITAIAGGTVVTPITGGVAGNSIKVTGITGSFTWTAGTLAGGVNNQATIIAYGNLYSGTCTGTVPSTYWAYNTGGKILTSVVLSGDGSQLAFIQTFGNSQAYLTILKWASGGGGTAGAPTVPTTETAANYRNCAAPCMTTIALSGANNDTHSSPFYDFTIGSDKLYVGDDGGILHQFTNVFLSGTPAENTANGWPVTARAGDILTSPVYDVGATAATSYVYVGDSAGEFHHVAQTTATTTTVVNSGALASAGDGIDDAPLLDSSTGDVYAFVRGDAAGTFTQVVQLPGGFASGATGASAGASVVSVSSNATFPATAMFMGTFDNNWFISPASNGYMYVCGTNAGLPALWKITVTGGALSAPTAESTLATANVECSPVTEFYNGSTDYVFMSVTNDAVSGTPINCGGTTGCVMAFTMTGGTVSATTSAHALEAGGASGIIVDGSSTATGASQVYFTPLSGQTCTTSGGVGGCAVQASQSELD